MARKRWQGGNWIRPEKRVAIYIRDGFRCLACYKDLSDSHPSNIQLDHLDPRSQAGSNETENVVTICTPCNFHRGDKPWREFYSAEAQARVEACIAKPINLKLARSMFRWLGKQSGFKVDGSSPKMVRAIRGEQ